MSTTEEQVQPTGKAAFAAARSSIQAQSQDQGPKEETPVEDKPSTETPPEEAEKVAAQVQDTADDTDQLWTPDKVAKLSPELRKQYDEMNRDYTRKSQKNASDRKEFEPWKPLIDGLTGTNPAAVVEELAQRLGLTVTKAGTVEARAEAVTQTFTSKALEKLPEELRPLFAPALEALKEELTEAYKGQLKPIVEQQSQMITEAAAAETEATIKSFTVTHPGWEKHEKTMIDIMGKLVPKPGAMTDLELMEMAYTLATANESEAEKTKKVVARINKAAESVEPNRRSGMPSEQVEHALPAPGKRGIREAYAAAKRGEAWTK